MVERRRRRERADAAGPRGDARDGKRVRRRPRSEGRRRRRRVCAAVAVAEVGDVPEGDAAVAAAGEQPGTVARKRERRRPLVVGGPAAEQPSLRVPEGGRARGVPRCDQGAAAGGGEGEGGLGREGATGRGGRRGWRGGGGGGRRRGGRGAPPLSAAAAPPRPKVDPAAPGLSGSDVAASNEGQGVRRRRRGLGAGVAAEGRDDGAGRGVPVDFFVFFREFFLAAESNSICFFFCPLKNFTQTNFISPDCDHRVLAGCRRHHERRQRSRRAAREGAAGA